MPDAVLRAAGALRHLYEGVDWAATSLGPMAGWSPALRGALDVVMHTRFPATLLWGPEFVLVYNEAYVEQIADKHPAALGRPAREVFPEAWSVIGPWLHAALDEGRGTWIEDAPVPLERHGLLEECYFTFSYSPVRGADGTVEGVLDIAAETTRQVLDRRRLALLGRLSEALGSVEREDDVAALALPVLRADTEDLPAVDVRVGRVPAGSGPGDLPDTPSRPVDDSDVLLDEDAGGRVAWLPLGREASGSRRSMLVVRLSDRLVPDAAYLGFLRLIASALRHALGRVSALEADRDLSLALQRSLLTKPREPAGLEVAVRYRPAALRAEIGGDWFDSFLLPDGALMVVVGDVMGHDRRAAAVMAQVRNLLRGVAFTSDGAPAHVLEGLDRAMPALGVDDFATAILARVEQDGAQATGGCRTLRWSNAGHPPPVLIEPDGTALVLEGAPDALLGLTRRDRTDHTVALVPGSTVVLYTDGLVERRGVVFDESLRWLTGTLTGCEGRSAEAICDRLMDAIGEGIDDDVALLVLRTT